MSKYTNQRDADNTEKLNGILNELPEFCKEYFVGISQRTTPLTRLNYAYDLRVFFNYMVTRVSSCKNKSMSEITLEDVENLSPFDIEYYLQYLSFYKDEQGNSVSNSEQGKSRKLVRTPERVDEKRNKHGQKCLRALMQMPRVERCAPCLLRVHNLLRFFHKSRDKP